ncbi:SRPBCC family protein [Sphingobacterium sp. NGMCC 1.201703]|uniref:SRPBCC family protein n=1 Tax=unclassified Sphingobacterium TaxID=2609468 RepID=UPI00098630B1|nr:SRPBCC family protein [Sphingobacterium sp. CZ-UAM]
MKKNFAKAEMFIRKDIAEVFQAMVDPAITTKIWFTKSSGKLEKGKTIEWEWEMYNHKVNVEVLEIVENQTLIFNWRNHDSPSLVEWKFKKITGGTFVSVTNTFEHATTEALIAEVRDSTEGFTLVLANLKAYLEFNILLNLVGDRFPEM